jgi:hypothetical protein
VVVATLPARGIPGTATETCPMCGCYSFDGDLCRPRCELGNLRSSGKEDGIIGDDFARISEGVPRYDEDV